MTVITDIFIYRISAITDIEGENLYMERNNILMFVAGILFAVFLAIMVSSINYNNQEQKFSSRLTIVSKYDAFENVTSLSECENLNLINTSYCFNGYVSSFFNYTLDDFDLYDDNGEIIILNVNNLTFQRLDTTVEEYLRQNGGKCTEWSIYYKELCSNTNFECKIIHNEGIPGIFYGHQYIAMYDSEHYCKLDQLNVECGSNTGFKVGNYSNDDSMALFIEKPIIRME